VNWLAARVRLRTRTILEILDLGFVFCAENGKSYVKLALAILLLPFAVCAAARAFGLHWRSTWVLAIALGKLAEGAFTVAAGQLLFADSVATATVLAAFGRLLVPYIATRIWAFLALAACILIVVPFPSMVSRALFVSEYCLLEAASPNQCLKRGARLMRSHTGRAFGLGFSLIVAQAGFVVIAEALGQGLVEFVLQLGRPVGSLFDDGGSPFALAGFFLSLPYFTAARFFAYVDSRTRAEGWDIQVRFAALVQRAAPKAAA
jgi:hypothetical protein